jgi:Zn-finger nucleic acid-binding protein
MQREGTWLHMCPDCRGVLVQDEQFRILQDHHAGEVPAEAAAGAVSSDRLATVRCPRCGAAMAKVVTSDDASPFHVDFCRQCGMFWFDRGELERAERHFSLPRGLRPAEEPGPETRAALAEAAFRTAVDEEEIRTDLVPLRLVANGIGVGIIAGNLFQAALRAARWGVDGFEAGLSDQGARRRRRFLTAAGGVVLFLVLALAALWVQGCFAGLEREIAAWWEGLWW